MSYQNLGSLIKNNDKMARAVGNALSKNQHLLIFPCHRIIKKNGDLNHFSCGGVEMKKSLLSFEKN